MTCRCSNRYSLVSSKQSRAGLVGSALAVDNAVGPQALLVGLHGNGKALDTKVVAYARDDQVRPFSVNNKGENKVCAEVPELEASGHGTKGGSGNGKVRVVDNQRSSNHGRQHDGPVGERLMGEMGQDNLGRHSSKDQRHGQAVENQVVILEELRVWRSQPSHGADNEDNQGRPFLDQWKHGLVPGSACTRNVEDAFREVRNEEGEEKDWHPEFLDSDFANLRLVRREVVGKRGRPDLRAEVSGQADEGAGENQALCIA